MSAIAGYWCRGGSIPPSEACDLILAGQSAFGPHGQNQHSVGDVSFGRALHRALPEDQFDRQPLSAAEGRILFCSDARIDNRQELAELLSIARPMLRRHSDAQLILQAWGRWGLDLVGHVLGDYAVAAWSEKDRELTLLRSPLSLKSLFYFSTPRFVAFASMPQGLLAIPAIERRLNFDHVASIAGGGFFTGIKTSMFEGIKPVEPGHAVRFGSGPEQAFPIWTFGNARSSPPSLREAGEELRSHLDRAVKEQSRRVSGPLSTHLSSGRDSSAVTASAATGCDPGEAPLLAFTAAPRERFAEGVPSQRLLDESEVAARTASLYGTKISHVICRPKPFALGPMLDGLHRHHYGPLLNPSNLGWWVQINEAAADRGSTLLFAGTAGNFSISAGGGSWLADVLAEGGIASWWRASQRVAGRSFRRWQTVADRSFGPMVPEGLYAAIRKAAGRSDLADRHRFPVLRQPFQERAEAISRQRHGDRRPPASHRSWLLRVATELDNSERMSLAGWGVEIRDPTADRRLVDFVLSLPAEMLASAESRRPLYEAAFGDRLPPAVVRPERRGYQAADWFEVFRPEEVRREFARYHVNPIVRELVDLPTVGKMIDAWPTNRASDLATIETYQNKLLGTLALASFIQVHFPA